MAQHRNMGGMVPVNFIDKRRATAGSTTTSVPSAPATPANYASLAAMDTRLLAIGGVYTQKYIDSMTMNDKVFALRNSDDAGTL